MTEIRVPYAADITAHDFHDRAPFTGRSASGRMFGGVVCNCGQVLAWFAKCPLTTRKGERCRGLVRSDLGHTVCASHGRRPDELVPLGLGRRAAIPSVRPSRRYV